MDQFTGNLAQGLRRFAMAGVGAITLTIDKSREIINQLAARGEISAAEGQAACDELHKKLTEQVSSFTRRLRADYENLSFEQMLVRAEKLSPEQKERLIEKLTQPAGADASAEAAEADSISEETEPLSEETEAPETESDSAEPSSPGQPA